ncbi:IS110 family transposase [Rhodococcus erythropolis]|nr:MULTISPECIES: transposase [Rhodococcus]MCJ0946952.1 IS110 family transposase [Rhodococcus sp. ARC_M8]ULD41409.1 IS110 family transposase [Rhodococcus qingshengii]QEX11896.1 IS110 family transposase [Rhodococcus erythropolis]UKO84316.1 IS110 family transposase [Rhodococcus erythropolis]BBE46514.1 hypothetical protein RE2895_34450 [Rhodococcus erythropolis]
MRVVDLPARAADTAFRGPVPGNGKTDAKDAFIIVDAARTLSDTLLPIGKACDLVEGLRMLSEFDADLAVDENRLTPAVDAVVGESMGVRTGVTMLIEITDIGRSATQGRSPFTPGSHLAHIAPERPSKVSTDNTAATPDSNAPSIFQRSLLSRIRSPVPTTTENELRAGVAGARLEVRVRAPSVAAARTPVCLPRLRTRW